MRTFLKVLFGFVAAVVILIVVAASWFFFYSGDLPDVGRLAQFAPTSTTSVSDTCLTALSIAIPYESIGENFRNALSAVELRLSFQISRTMFCTPSKVLHRELDEMRTATRLERHFTQQELFAIYANRAGFGGDLIGVQSASQYFFHKNPAELNIAEAALLAGLVQGPSYLSPVRHPDRALERRNQVIDAMVQAGTITASEAEGSKSAPLGIAVSAPTPRVQ
jgi:membrane carboxypeptidase/penicillin-binding protein